MFVVVVAYLTTDVHQHKAPALPKNGEFGHMCVPSKGDGCALGLDAIEHFVGNLAPAIRGH